MKTLRDMMRQHLGGKRVLEDLLKLLSDPSPEIVLWCCLSCSLRNYK